MNIAKEGRALGGGTPSAEELALIRAYTRGDVEAGALYTFPVVLCDNEVDRDGECFDAETVGELAELFVGKSGITDHEWRSENQIARIYRTALERDEGRTTAAGERYVRLKAWAYMLRGEATAPLIADIEGGIKKEVSVGCAVRERRCSICGRAEGDPDCGHVRGERYDGKLCCTVLSGATDAYEWSFVAVPAQRAAGVTKAGAPRDGLRTLRAEAALGRAYLAELRGEVRRLGLICDGALYKSMDGALAHMDAAALIALRDSLRTRAAELLPLQPQLPAGRAARFDGEAYRV